MAGWGFFAYGTLMRLNELDVVNDCLSTMGESPLNSIQTDHPLVASSLKLLREANARTQASGWWFNREVVTLTPDTRTRNIVLPADFLSVDPQARGQRYSQRGRRLYDMETQSVVFDKPVEVAIARLIPFEDLPWVAQDLVRFATVIRFLESYDSDEIRIQQVTRDYMTAYQACQNEHTRFTTPNVLSQGGVARRRAAIRITGSTGLRTR